MRIGQPPTETPASLAADLDLLEERGWLVIPGALAHDEVARVRDAVADARARGWEEGLNHVGNMWFDSLLARRPEVFGPLVGHPSVAPHLMALYGRQCQLRSLRAHINPGPYLQEWHLDFYGYWDERRACAGRRLAAPPFGVNTTFYLQDNGPGMGRLTFVRGGHLRPPPHLYPLDHQAFERWCDAQPHDVVHPRAGDCVLFCSHIPHQGAKEDPRAERSNVVLHWQACPMHERVWHVSQPLGHQGTFPFADDPALRARGA